MDWNLSIRSKAFLSENNSTFFRFVQITSPRSAPCPWAWAVKDLSCHIPVVRMYWLWFTWQYFAWNQLNLLGNSDWNPSIRRTLLAENNSKLSGALDSSSSLPLGLYSALEAVRFNPNPASVLFNFLARSWAWSDCSTCDLAVLICCKSSIHRFGAIKFVQTYYLIKERE